MPGSRKNNPEPQSMLVVLPTWVGDFVMATPLLRALRHRFVDARITFLMEPNLSDLVRGGDWMDECVTWPTAGRALSPSQSGERGRWLPALPPRSPFSREYRKLIRDLRTRHFDWAILLPNSFRSALVAWQSRAKRRIGYNRDGRGLLLTDRIAVTNRRNRPTDQSPAAYPPGLGDGPPRSVQVTNIPLPPGYKGRYSPMPLVEYYGDLAEAIGCDRPNDRLELFTTPDCDASLQEKLTAAGIADRRPLVVLSPGAKYGAAKCWPADRFANVADRLVELQNAAVVITCGPGEEPIARAIRDTMKNEATVMDDPGLTLGELKSLIKRCDLLIGNDAGPRHLAKAFGVPIVTIFGPTHPDWTATNYEAERIIRVDIECGPCQQRQCPLGHLRCMTEVEPSRVYRAALELLSQQPVLAGGSQTKT